MTIHLLRRAREKGVALITAMIVMALATIVAADLAWDNALDIRRTTMLLYRDQAVQVALGAENWVASILRQDLQDTETDHLAELWASELPPLPIDGGEVFGVVEDLQGRFNVNNLIDGNGEVHEESLEQFQRLLEALELDPRFAAIAADWIDPDADASFPDGAEDGIYTGINPPYRPPNQLLSNINELAALNGMDKLTFDTLAPHIVALPGRTNINVNTATPHRFAVARREHLSGRRRGPGFGARGRRILGCRERLRLPGGSRGIAATQRFFDLLPIEGHRPD